MANNVWERDLKKRHSQTQSVQICRHGSQSENYCKSDGDLNLAKHLVDRNRKHSNCPSNTNVYLDYYYKKYEHDEVPVKDPNCKDLSATGDKVDVTNNDFSKLDMKVYKIGSQEIQIDTSSMSSIDSNIKFFKTTVQEIFDKFYASMQDFELYKKRFHDILSKNRAEAVEDMEDFIKDMIHHIMSSEGCLSSDSKKSIIFVEVRDKQTNVSSVDDSSLGIDTSLETNSLEEPNLDSLLDTSTHSVLHDRTRRTARNEDRLNIYLLGGNPYVQIKMNERNLLSEIHIKEPNDTDTESNHAASADNLKKLAEKKLELERCIHYQGDYDLPDKEIPVKVSYARKDIHAKDSEVYREREHDKSFISKICGFLCKTFRKSTFS